MDMEGNGRMDWFFRQWVDGTTIPEYRLTWRVEAAEGGKWRLIGSVAQSQVEESFMMRVPVYMEFGGGKIVRLGSLGRGGQQLVARVQRAAGREAQAGVPLRLRGRAVHGQGELTDDRSARDRHWIIVTSASCFKGSEIVNRDWS